MKENNNDNDEDDKEFIKVCLGIAVYDDKTL